MYRILSLDGYGAWSLIQVRALQELFGPQARGREVLAHFDLVASHASGSVVAAALAADWPLTKILGLFLDEAARKTVLIPAHCPAKGTKLAFNPASKPSGRRYEALVALLHPLANTPLAELPETIRTARGTPVHFLFVGFDSTRQQAAMMRSDVQSAAAGLMTAARARLVEAVYAASNIPQDLAGGFHRNSGALCGITNPVMPAIVEAMANGRARDEIEVLSLGTGNTRLAPSRHLGLPGTAVKLGANVMLGSDGLPPAPITDDPPDASAFMAHVALGQPLPSIKLPGPICSGSLVRMNPMVEPIVNSHGSAYLPTLAQEDLLPGKSSEAIFQELVGLGSNAAEQHEVQAIRALADAWIADRVNNQAIRSDAMGKCEIGHRWFSAAREAWLARERLGNTPRAAAVLAERQMVAPRPGRTTLV